MILSLGSQRHDRDLCNIIKQLLLVDAWDVKTFWFVEKKTKKNGTSLIMKFDE